jgi:hypothetical protein
MVPHRNRLVNINMSWDHKVAADLVFGILAWAAVVAVALVTMTTRLVLLDKMDLVVEVVPADTAMVALDPVEVAHTLEGKVAANIILAAAVAQELQEPHQLCNQLAVLVCSATF